MALNMPVTNWTAIVPIRSLTEGKTRLAGYPGASVLTEAFAKDVIAACMACPEIDNVALVSPDPRVVELASASGCNGIAESDSDPDGINDAIAHARRELPDVRSIVAILGDLPCIDGSSLSAILTAAGEHETSFVSDTAGTGTTIWCTSDPSARSHFGHHSRAEHRAAGAIELGLEQTSLEWARARRDVDTDIDLWDAARLGLGPATRALVQPTLLA